MRPPLRVLSVALAAVLAGSGAAHAQPPRPVPPGPELPSLPDPPQMSAQDRILFNAALDALVVGDFTQARGLFLLLARNAESGAARLAATVIVDRIGGVEQRRAAGLLAPGELVEAAPPSPAPVVVTQVGPQAVVLELPDSVGRAPLPPPRRPGVGMRPATVGTAAAFGLALWGWTVPTALGFDIKNQGDRFVGAYLVTASSSLVAPLLATSRWLPTPTQYNLMFYGGTRGAEWALLFSNLLFGRAGGHPDESQRAFATSLLLGSLAGMAGGAIAGRTLDLDAGQARTIAVGGDFGLLAGFGLAHAFGFHRVRDGATIAGTADGRARRTSAMGLLGSALGLGGGYVLAGKRDHTWGDGEVMRGAGLLGLLGAATIGEGMLDPDSRFTAAFWTIGAGLGLAAGDRYVQGTAYTPGEAILVDLALVGGALTGAGLAYLVVDSDRARATPYLAGALIGAGLSGGAAAWSLGMRSRILRDELARAQPPVRVSLLPRFDPTAGRGIDLVGSF